MVWRSLLILSRGRSLMGTGYQQEKPSYPNKPDGDSAMEDDNLQQLGTAFNMRCGLYRCRHSVLYIRWCKHSECRRIFLADTFIFNRYLGCYPFYRIAAQKHPFADVYSSDFNIFEWGAEWIVA